MKALRSNQDHEEPQRKKMLLSSRANPPKPLKLGGPERYLSLKSLLPATPIPSPSLPSILPRHGKKPPKLNSRRFVRALLWLSCVIGLYYLLTSVTGKTEKTLLNNLASFPSFQASKTYEVVGAVELPDHPAAIALTDSEGKQQWTIFIPQARAFPLPSTEYAEICSQAEEAARHVAGRRQKSRGNNDFDPLQYDPKYIDVDEAQSRHFLPKDRDAEIEHAAKNDASNLPVCNTSLTYVLDATDAGLGSALLAMWLSYSLAERQDRSFFIDDTNFPYGNYSTFFIPPTTPACRPPPPSHRVPCPHQAKHLVVSAATTKWIFGESFHRHHTSHEMFDMARTGYDALFKLRKEDDDYVRTRTAKLRGGTATGEDVPRPENGLVGIHIRRGDRHPYEFAYELGYLPPDRYMAVARKLVGHSDRWKLMLASDDAEMYDNIELPDTIRAQQRISLASKKSLGSGLGWEGGFFKDVFWSLGLPAHAEDERRIGSPAPTKAKSDLSTGSLQQASAANLYVQARDYRTNPTKEALQLRELLGRAYLLDLAMLAQSDKVVCGVSSNACRILAVMLGWKRAFENGDWINVDGDYGWRALDY